MAEAREHEETEWEARDIERTRSGIIGRDDTVVTITGEARRRIPKAAPIEFGGTLQTIPPGMLVSVLFERALSR